MALHIITALYRFEYLEKVYNSINMDSDIVWHIAKSNRREDLDYAFLKEDKRIRLYNVDCEDDGVAGKKRASALENVKDGYFCFLDDDTLFHENMYIKYRECMENNFKGMLVGNQVDWDGGIRLVAHHPVFHKIDVGNVLCHHGCLSVCKWPTYDVDKRYNKDYIFWRLVYEHYSQKCELTNTTISYYNMLSEKKTKWVNSNDLLKKVSKSRR
jgi:hypothetical protein